MSIRSYLRLNSAEGLPAGRGIWFECECCGDSLPSQPEHAIACSCRNVVVDADAGRVAVKDHSKLRAYETS